MDWVLFRVIGRYLVDTNGQPWVGAVSRKWDGRFHRTIDTIEKLFGSDRSRHLGVVGCLVLTAAVGAQETEILVRFLHQEAAVRAKMVAEQTTWELMELLREAMVATNRRSW